MEKILHVASTFKSHEVEDGSVMIRGMASTDHSDRAGDVIAADAWAKGGLENFKNNPVILFNHDYNKPIGRATGVSVTKNGLELEAKISKAAKDVCELVKDGVLGAFSVGFKVKDADYVKETDGLMIKDAELFEVSVVSVPCNQAATFSLAKSFDSIAEYEEFKKTFTNRVDLPGQSLTSKDSIESNVVSDAPKHVEKSTNKETKMSEDNTPAIDLEAFAKKVADETAAKIAMKQAEQKSAEEAEAKAQAEAAEQKVAQEEQVKSTIRTGIETGAEKLMADVEAKLAEKDAKLEEVMAEYGKDLEEKKAEIAAMQESKRSFSDRGNDLTKFGKDFMYAHILGKVTGKGYDTDFARSVMSKAGSPTFTANSSDTGKLDTLALTQFEEDLRLEQKIAGLFREIAVNSGATVIPTVSDTNAATFSGAGVTTTSNTLENRTQSSANDFVMGTVTAYADRLIAGTFIPNDTDEQVYVTILPMIVSALARAHARALDQALLFGTGSLRPAGTTDGPVTTNFKGLVGSAGVDGSNSIITSSTVHGGLADGTSAGNVTRANMAPGTCQLARSKMGKFGIDPSQLAYIMGTEAYYNLVEDTGFADITDVGSDIATKLTGQLGSVFGSPVIVTDLLDGADGGAVDVDGSGGSVTSDFRETTVISVNRNAFVMPRLKGVSIETDYEVAAQRTAVVASQSIGFTQIDTGAGAAVRVTTAGS